MQNTVSRRRLLTGAAALAVAAPPFFSQAIAQTPARRLLIERRVIEVRGRAASVFGLRQPDGRHGLVLEPGERFLVDLENRCGEETVIHWHGQTPPYAQDGVADAARPTLAVGETRRYDFAPRPGSHWMHSHHGLQEQLLMAAPLIVRTAADRAADVQDVVVLLHDFTFADPAEVLAGLTGGGSMDHSAHGGGHGQGHGGTTAPGAQALDLNDVEYDAYLANDRTLDDPEVFRVDRGGRVRLRLINGATSTAFLVDLGALTGVVVAVDGNPVAPAAARVFPMTMGQRLDILIELPATGGAFPVLAVREGDRKRTGFVLATPGATVGKLAGEADAAAPPVDLSLERRLTAAAPLGRRAADAVFTIRLTGSMSPYVWTIDGAPFGRHRPLAAPLGARVEIDMINETDMAHPMHLHGFHFQVVGLNGAAQAGAVRDTVLVPVGGAVRVAFDADNPGRWPLHCHNLLHMATGMMTEVVVA